MRVVLALAGASLLAGCASSITLPAAVRLSKGEMLYGNTTASTTGGYFEVNELHGKFRCGGNYDPFDHARTISADFTCSDGRTGTITVTRRTDTPGGSGSLRMNDGTTGYVAFGADAQTITASAPAAPQQSQGGSAPQPPRLPQVAAAPATEERGKEIVTAWTGCAVTATKSFYSARATPTEIAEASVTACVKEEARFQKWAVASGIKDPYGLTEGMRKDITNIIIGLVLKARNESERRLRTPAPTSAPKAKIEEI